MNGSGGATDGPSSAMTGGVPGSGGSSPTEPSTVVVVAHQDDDLLFINPELKHTLDRGERLTTVYVTSGNAGMGMDYVTERELGIRSAYAFMTGEQNTWACNTASYGKKSIRECVFSGSADLRLLFFRLVDGWADGSETGSIQSLWNGSASSSTSVDGSGLSFTREELVNTLTDVLHQRGATRIFTTDFSFRDPANDHSDHEHAALFSVAASGRYPWPHELHSHLTYGTTSASPNLSEIDTHIVGDTFGFYASCDREIEGCTGGVGCDQHTCSTTSALYSSWFSRSYSYARLAPPLTGSLSSNSGTCLGELGTSAAIVACGSASSLSHAADFSLTRADGRCLTSPPLATSKELLFSPCAGSPHQKWFVMDNGHIVLGAAPDAGDVGSYDASQCLSASAGVGSSARVEDCKSGAHLEWSF